MRDYQEEKRQEEVSVQKKLDIVRAYKTIFETSEGKDVLQDLMKTSFFTKSIFTPEPNTMAYYEGRRSVVLDILALLDKKEEDILKILERSKNQEEEYLI